MELPSLDALGTLLVFVWPGVLALQVYRLIMPARPLEWKDVLAQGLFYSVINYLLLFPAAVFVLNVENLEDHTWRYWGCILLLLLIGPVVLPNAYKYAHSWSWLRGKIQAPYPTSWDYFFGRRKPVFILVHLKDGRMVGGYWGAGSYASSYPADGDLYISTACRVDKDGRFREIIDGSDGIHIHRDQFTYLEFFRSHSVRETKETENVRRSESEIASPRES